MDTGLTTVLVRLCQRKGRAMFLSQSGLGWSRSEVRGGIYSIGQQSQHNVQVSVSVSAKLPYG